MNTFTQTLGLSAVLLAAITTTAHAKEVKVGRSMGTGDEHVTHTYQCEDSSGSTTEETRTIGTGSFSSTKITEEVLRYSKCKLVNTELFIRNRK